MMKLGSVWFFQNRSKGKLLQSSGIFRDMLNKKSYTCTYQAGWSGRQMFRTAKITKAICSGSAL
jgi:hypothetical protein